MDEREDACIVLKNDLKDGKLGRAHDVGNFREIFAQGHMGLHRVCTEVRNEKLFVSADDHQVHPLLITLVHFTMKPTMYCRDFFHPMVG